jgi:hypothetical protein
MELIKLTGNYFPYCQLCRHDGKCKLRHDEFLGILTPVCRERLLYNPEKGKLACKHCGDVEHRRMCRKFNPEKPAGILPLVKQEYKAAMA